MFTKSVAGLGLILRLFKVVGTSSRPLAVHGMAKYQAVPVFTAVEPISPEFITCPDPVLLAILAPLFVSINLYPWFKILLSSWFIIDSEFEFSSKDMLMPKQIYVIFPADLF